MYVYLFRPFARLIWCTVHMCSIYRPNYYHEICLEIGWMKLIRKIKFKFVCGNLCFTSFCRLTLWLPTGYMILSLVGGEAAWKRLWVQLFENDCTRFVRFVLRAGGLITWLHFNAKFHISYFQMVDSLSTLRVIIDLDTFVNWKKKSKVGYTHRLL
jgi:hypothetical protein